MKKLRKLLAVLVTVAMAIGMLSVSALAAGTGTITITPPTGTAANEKTTYSVYKVFDADGNGATSISYKLLNGKSTSDEAWTSSGMGTYFKVDTAGNITAQDAATGTDGELSSGAIDAIKAYVIAAALPKAANDVTTTGTSNAEFTDLANGYYYVTTTTGTAVSITSTNPDAQVKDKNATPTVGKTVLSVMDGQVVSGSIDTDGKNALAQLGSTVTYQAQVTLGNGSKNVKFHDVMGSGLTYKNDVKVYTDAAHTTEAGNDVVTSKATATGDTLTVTFEDGKEGTYYIVYSATVNSDALTVDTGKNTAKVSYGDPNSSISSTPSETNVYNAKFTVTKTDGNNQPLAGAGFVIFKQGTDGVVYYQKNGNDVNWVSDINQATELTTTADSNVVAFTGLANGTYTLVEKTVPAGYNKAAPSTFTVAEHDYRTTNLEQAKTVVNNAGSALPTTGGMGTTIFYVLGAAFVIGAGIVLVTRRKLSK